VVINAFYTADDKAEAEESLAVAINGEEGVHRPRNWRLPLLSTHLRPFQCPKDWRCHASSHP
jgi:hypothetical protein